MQQFGPQFINGHLMPLLEEMLTDTVQRKKDYLDKLFINGVLEDQEKKNLMDYYFNAEHKNSGVPFVDPEEKKDRENLIKYFVDYVRSRGAKPEDRFRAFLPVVDQKSVTPGQPPQVVWPADVKRNLFMMSYHMAESFEKDQINELIAARAATGKPEDVEQAKKDKELLDKGQLILVKDPVTGEFTKYIRATELKAGDTAVQFLPPPPQEMATMMQQGFVVPNAQTLQNIGQGAVSPQTVASASKYQPNPKAIPDQVSSNDELTKSFQQKRGKAMVNQLKKQGMQILGDVMFDNNGHAMVKVKSGNDTLLVAVDTRLPFDQDLKFNFTFQDGPSAGKSFAVDESKLAQAFVKADGSLRTAQELYKDVELCKQLGIQSDAYPAQAPQIKPPVPQVGQPKAQIPPVAPPFKIPPGVQPPKPLAGVQGPQGQVALGGEGQLQLPTGIKAPPMPKAPGEKEEGKAGVGVKLKTKPVLPGIPSGSVMAQKLKLQQQQEEQQQLVGAGNLPIAPGRVGGVTLAVTGGAGAPPKSNIIKIAVASNVGGFLGATGLGGVLGGGGETPKVAWNVIKGVWIALSNYLPHLFG